MGQTRSFIYYNLCPPLIITFCHSSSVAWLRYSQNAIINLLPQIILTFLGKNGENLFLTKFFITAAKILYDCGDMRLNHGFVNLISNITTPILKVTLICNEGYVLVGDYIRYCYNDSKWSGKESTCGKWSV